MNADLESLDPATWSTFARRSDDSVIEVFSFILLLYYEMAVEIWNLTTPATVGGPFSSGTVQRPGCMCCAL